MKRKLATLFIMLSATIITGCMMQYTRTSEIDRSSTILIMPPRDAIQGGMPHPAAKGTGSQLQRSLKKHLNDFGFSNVYIFDSTSVMNNSSQIDRNDALKVARDLKFKYVMVLSLGEFRNAAPLTFRTDFMTLQDGHLIDSSTGLDVWTLDKPIEKDKENLGNVYPLIDKIATLIAKSLIK